MHEYWCWWRDSRGWADWHVAETIDIPACKMPRYVTPKHANSLPWLMIVYVLLDGTQFSDPFTKFASVQNLPSAKHFRFVEWYSCIFKKGLLLESSNVLACGICLGLNSWREWLDNNNCKDGHGAGNKLMQ
jgi:hypothetical protein